MTRREGLNRRQERKGVRPTTEQTPWKHGKESAPACTL